MMTSSNGNIFSVNGPLSGEFTGDRWIHLKKASGAELWCFFDLRQTQQFSKQSRRRWFQTPSRLLWRHCNGRRYICNVIPNWKRFYQFSLESIDVLVILLNITSNVKTGFGVTTIAVLYSSTASYCVSDYWPRIIERFYSIYPSI